MQICFIDVFRKAEIEWIESLLFTLLEEKKMDCWEKEIFAICYNLQQRNTNVNCWYSYTTNELANEEKDTNIAEWMAGLADRQCSCKVLIDSIDAVAWLRIRIRKWNNENKQILGDRMTWGK